MGFRAGRGAASAIRRAEVWKLRAASARLLERRTLDGRDMFSWVRRRRGIAVFERREKLAVMGDGRQRCLLPVGCSEYSERLCFAGRFLRVIGYVTSCEGSNGSGRFSDRCGFDV